MENCVEVHKFTLHNLVLEKQTFVQTVVSENLKLMVFDVSSHDWHFEKRNCDQILLWGGKMLEGW